jgi:hypothetical protein
MPEDEDDVPQEQHGSRTQNGGMLPATFTRSAQCKERGCEGEKIGEVREQRCRIGRASLPKDPGCQVEAWQSLQQLAGIGLTEIHPPREMFDHAFGRLDERDVGQDRDRTAA